MLNVKYQRSNVRSRGFTLIELLVVITVIGFLLTVAFVAFENARSKARDAKRVANIDQIRKALDLYFNSQGSYPIVGSPGIALGTDNYDVLCSGTTDSGFKGDISDCGLNATLYVDHVPKAFGVVSDDVYSYEGTANDYTLTFYLEKKVEALGPGPCTAKPGSVSCP